MSEELPPGWAKITLQQAGAWSSGGTPSRRRPEFFGKGVRWVKSGDLPDGPILKTDEEITDLGLQNSSAKLMAVGTISMALYGATIGKLGLMIFPAATNQACANVNPDSRLVDSSYLFHYLLSERQNFIEQGQGGAQPNISQEIVRAHPFRLAPLAEQRRIAVKLEMLLGRVASCQQRLTKIPALLKRFRQSVLAAACSGRLTAHWRGENPQTDSASETLRAHAKRTAGRERNTRRMKTATGLTLLDYSDDFPATWTWLKVRELVALGAIFDVQDGNHGELYPRVEDFGEVGVPYISAEHIINDRVQLASAPRLKREKAKQLRIGFAKANDVILTHNATVGRVAIMLPDSPDVVLSTSTTYYRVDEAVLLARYLATFLRSRYFQSQLEALMEQTTRNQVSVTKQVELGVALPPLPEQQEIVRRVEKLFALADRLEARFSDGRKQIDRITQAILAKAFRGELVPTEFELAKAEGRSFESAEQLLARIRATSGGGPNGNGSKSRKQKNRSK
jgi:type I restriction enzyme S subunit